MRELPAIDIIPSFVWTDEAVQKLTAMWLDGDSAGRIALELGATRNMIVGKVNRLGLLGAARAPLKPPLGREQAKPRPSKTRARIAPSEPPVVIYDDVFMAPIVDLPFDPAPEPVEVIAMPIDVLPKPEPEPVEFFFGTLGELDGAAAAIQSLTEYTCRWPIGDPTESDFRFCREPTTIAFPYCVEHAALGQGRGTLSERRALDGFGGSSFKKRSQLTAAFK